MSKPFAVVGGNLSSLSHWAASETGNSTPAVHPGKGTRELPQVAPVGKKLVEVDKTSVRGLAVE